MSTMKTIEELADDVVTQGGAIVSSGDCSLMEISNAQACQRFAVREADGMGFVRRPKEWLMYAMDLVKDRAASERRFVGAANQGMEEVKDQIHRAQG